VPVGHNRQATATTTATIITTTTTVNNGGHFWTWPTAEVKDPKGYGYDEIRRAIDTGIEGERYKQIQRGSEGQSGNWFQPIYERLSKRERK